MAKEHEEFYDRICSKNFEVIHQKLDSICDLLKGKNGEPGIVDEVRNNARFRKRTIWVLATIIGTTITQIIIWIRQRVTGG